MEELQTLLAAIEAFAKIGEEETRKVRNETGFDMHNVVRAFSGMEREAKIRLIVSGMPAPLREALVDAAYALTIDSGPDYRSAMQKIFYSLIGTNGYSWQDAKYVHDLFGQK